jgi:hypothetical protein
MLISAILLFLGVPLWMIAGMIILIIWNRRRVKKQPGIFPVKVRYEAASAAEKQPKWPRKGYAQWVHDVLIVRTGMGLMQSTPYGIHGVETAEQDADPHEVKGLGDHPKVLRARLDDGIILQVALAKIHPELAPDRLLAEREQKVADAKQNE